MGCEPYGTTWEPNGTRCGTTWESNGTQLNWNSNEVDGGVVLQPTDAQVEQKVPGQHRGCRRGARERGRPPDGQLGGPAWRCRTPHRFGCLSRPRRTDRVPDGQKGGEILLELKPRWTERFEEISGIRLRMTLPPSWVICTFGKAAVETKRGPAQTRRSHAPRPLGTVPTSRCDWGPVRSIALPLSKVRSLRGGRGSSSKSPPDVGRRERYVDMAG
jgi:hypothetical protein